MSFTCCLFSRMFFFNATPTTEIYPLSLHDALPISVVPGRCASYRPPTPPRPAATRCRGAARRGRRAGDRKSTRLNSSHANISYAVFCLKKKMALRTEEGLEGSGRAKGAEQERRRVT